jgi:hypothetical protein
MPDNNLYLKLKIFICKLYESSVKNINLKLQIVDMIPNIPPANPPNYAITSEYVDKFLLCINLLSPNANIIEKLHSHVKF